MRSCEHSVHFIDKSQIKNRSLWNIETNNDVNTTYRYTVYRIRHIIYLTG